MDSAAAYSMTLPDEGSPSWDGYAFVGRAVVSLADSLYTFSVFTLSGSGDVTFDFGDGTTQTVTFPAGTTSLSGEIANDKLQPYLKHEYAADGRYMIRVTGNLTGMTFAGHHRLGGDEPVNTSNTNIDWTSALHDILHMPFTPQMNDMLGLWNVDTLMFDATNMACQYVLNDYDPSTGDINHIYMLPGPKKIIARGAFSQWTFSAGGYYYRGVALFSVTGLEEFYAPNLLDFGGLTRVGSYSESYRDPPFAACGNLKVVYVPSLTKIAHMLFVSPSATGVKIYTGRLGSIHANAFGYTSGSTLPWPASYGQCNVELFCRNTRQEILNFSSYPFGASYLKCHCTDITFDNQGKFWRNSDGRRVDSNGQLVNESGHPVDESGHLVKYDEVSQSYVWCDEFDAFVDENDRPYDRATGFLLDRDGHVCDECGRKCDTLGNLLSERYWNGEDWTYVSWGAECAVVTPTWAEREIRYKWYSADDADDPRHNKYYTVDNVPEGYDMAYFDDNGYLRVLETVDGDLYTIEYTGGKEWYPVLYMWDSGEEEEPEEEEEP